MTTATKLETDPIDRMDKAYSKVMGEGLKNGDPNTTIFELRQLAMLAAVKELKAIADEGEHTRTNRGHDIKVWITKYAMTSGIEEIEAIVSTTSDRLIVESNPGQFCRSFYPEGREWHRTRQKAVDCAEDMRVKKLASLRKQIARIEKLKF